MSVADTVTAADKADTSKARVYYTDRKGSLIALHFSDQKDAYAMWLGLRKGVRASFRGANDARPVYSWDLVDRL